MAIYMSIEFYDGDTGESIVQAGTGLNPPDDNLESYVAGIAAYAAQALIPAAEAEMERMGLKWNS